MAKKARQQISRSAPQKVNPRYMHQEKMLPVHSGVLLHSFPVSNHSTFLYTLLFLSVAVNVADAAAYGNAPRGSYLDTCTIKGVSTDGRSPAYTYLVECESSFFREKRTFASTSFNHNPETTGEICYDNLNGKITATSCKR